MRDMCNLATQQKHATLEQSFPLIPLTGVYTQS